MSLRTPATEARYQADKAAGRTRALADEPSLREWEHWRLIDNPYPHDRWYSTHHMLVPKRIFSSFMDATKDEMLEFLQITFSDTWNQYGSVKINHSNQQSKPEHFHTHLAIYLPELMV